MKTTKAQISTFFLVGLVILFLFFLGFLALNNVDGFGLTQEQITERLVVREQQVSTAVTDCLHLHGTTAFEQIGLQGRLYPKRYIEYEDIQVYDAAKRLVTLPELEREVSFYLREHVPECITNTIDSIKGATIEVEEEQVTTRITDKEVVLEWTQPITIRISTQQLRLERFSSTFPVRLRSLWNASEAITSTYTNQRLINLTHVDTIDATTVIWPYSDGSYILVFEDNQSRLKGMGYAYSFGLEG